MLSCEQKNIKIHINIDMNYLYTDFTHNQPNYYYMFFCFCFLIFVGDFPKEKNVLEKKGLKKKDTTHIQF